MIYLLLLETEDDRKAFLEIYNRNHHKMYYVALKILHDEAGAEDAVHGAFLSLADKFEKYSHISGRQMDNFCVSIVKNKVIDIIRYRNHFTDKEIEEMNFYKESEAASPEQAVLRSEMNKMLERVLQEISEVYREAMLLKYVHGLSYKEIAKLQGVSEKTVEQRIYRGKQKLKEVIHEAEAE